LQQRLFSVGQRVHHSRITLLGYPALCCGVGAFILYRIGGFPPSAWSTFYQLLPTLPTFMQQHSLVGFLLVAQAFCWLVAWAALAGLGILVASRCRLLLAPEVPAEFESWDMRALRQMGVKPSAASTTRRREKQQIQRRRRIPASPAMPSERVVEKML
jgi:hypothetical protein